MAAPLHGTLCRSWLPDDRMAENDPDKLKGPGGLTLRQIHEQVRKSVARDRKAQKVKNALAQKPSRWQRFVRYVWNKKNS
jgi:hypothetical protein